MNDLFRFDEFELNPARRSLTRTGTRTGTRAGIGTGEAITLAPKTFDVLAFLVEHPGRVILKQELLEAVWPGAFVEESNLTQHIFWIRKALGDRARCIVTVPGRGYHFVCPVEVIDQTPQPSAAVVEAEAGIVPGRVDPVALAAPVLPRPSRRRMWALLAVAVLLLTALTASAIWRRLHAPVPGDHHEIVLADFEDTTNDPTFGSSLKTLLAIDLEQSPYLVLAAGPDIEHALTLMDRPAATRLTPPVARELCQRLNDQAVLTGAITSIGHAYLVTLTATNCQDGRSLASTKASATDREDVLRAVDVVAADMRGRLGEKLKSQRAAGQPLQPAHTFSLDALRVYSQALALEVSSHQRESIPLFQRAFELDPKFAAAYLGLAIACNSVGENASARAAIARAYELRDQSDDFLKLNIVNEYNIIVTGDLHAIQRNLLNWTQLYPNQPQPWIDLAGNLHALGQFQQAIEPARRALALAPNSSPARAALCYAQLNAGFVDEAKATCREAVRLHLDSGFMHGMLRHIAYLQHDSAAWATEVAWVKTTDEATTYPVLNLFSEGKAHAAVALWEQRVQLARDQGLLERAYIRESALLHRESDYQMNADLRQLLLHHGPRPWPYDRIIADCELGRLADADADLKFYTSLMQGAQPPGSQLPDYSHNTTQRDFYYPQALAHIALAHHHPEEAIADLEITHALDNTTLESNLLRGRAYLAARQPALAETEFHILLDRPYRSYGSPMYPLAQLGLARALEMQGKHGEARTAYEALFALWKDADADLTPLVQARTEYAKLPSA
jgi:DNA-binding winged helix-turn-helix (wHTH) protein/tetratricopeptide (TPR) repeat protein